MHSEKAQSETKLVGDLFRELFSRVSRLESKKYMYKDLNELTLIEIDTIIVIGSTEMRSMSDIAKKLGVSFGTPTVTIDRLISKGFVQRIRDEEDRRQVFIKLSDKGINIYNAIKLLKDEATQKLFGILSPEERQVTIQVLNKILDNFTTVMDS